MIFEVPLPFIAPSFYGMDISEVPMLVGTFALGPVAGVVMELVKILVKLILKPTSTGFVGSLPISALDAPLCCRPVLFTGLKRRKGGCHGNGCGTVIMTIVAVILNAVVMLPFYSHFMPLDTIIAAGAAINPAISNVDIRNPGCRTL